MRPLSARTPPYLPEDEMMEEMSKVEKAEEEGLSNGMPMWLAEEGMK